MRGIMSGAAILTLFGGFWCIASLAFWPSSPAWSIPTAAVATSILLVLCIVRLIGAAKLPASNDPAAAAKGKREGRLFGIVFGIEGGLIALSAALLGRAGLGVWVPVAVASIVAAHFFPLAHIFEMPLYYWTGAVSLLGTLACLFISTAGLRGFSVGLLMAAVLWLTTVVLLVRTRSAPA